MGPGFPAHMLTHFLYLIGSFQDVLFPFYDRILLGPFISEVRSARSLVLLDGQIFHLFKCPGACQELLLKIFISLHFKQYGLDPKPRIR